jgi:hypothetical protein
VLIDPTSGRNLYPGSEGVLVRTTPRKLLAALNGSLPARSSADSVFVGRVEYLSSEDIHQCFSNALDRYGVEAFSDPRLRAQSLLVKRQAFAHESEVRLLYVEQRRLDKVEGRVQVRMPDVNQLIDEVRFDPRINADLGDRKFLAQRDYGRPPYVGPITTWPAYQRTLLEVWIDPTNDYGDWTPEHGRRPKP